MAGTKATPEEKTQIRDLFKEGYNIADIRSRFPHIDGRVLSGMYRKMMNPQSPRVDGFASSASQGATPVGSLDSVGVRVPQTVEAETTGFTPEAQTSTTPTGFKQSWREYFIVKKLDPPNDGVIKTEYPPFGISELMERYPSGAYEIQHYRDGRMFSTYREKIAPRGGEPIPGYNSGITSDYMKPDSTGDLLIKAADVYQKISSEARRSVEDNKMMASSAESSERMAKAEVEKSAITGLLDVVKESTKQKEVVPDPVSDKLMVMMQEERKTMERKYQMEMGIMEKKAESDLNRERERMSAESERLKVDMEHREKMQLSFMSEMNRIRSDESDRVREYQEKMLGEVAETRQAVYQELEEKKKSLDELSVLQRKHIEEISQLKLMMNGSDKDLEVARIIKDGVVGGIDRVGHRLDLMMDKGLQQQQQQQNVRQNGNGRQPQPQPHPTEPPPRPPSDYDSNTYQLLEDRLDPKGEEMALTKERIREVVKEEWFQDLEEEIFRTVAKRLETEDPRMKPHGSMLGQSFVEKMNTDKTIRTYFHYLCSRRWAEIMEDAGDGIKEEHTETLSTEEAGKWFEEFQSYLIMAWNSSIGIR